MFLKTDVLEYKYLLGIIVDQRVGYLASNNHFGRDVKKAISKHLDLTTLLLIKNTFVTGHLPLAAF